MLKPYPDNLISLFKKCWIYLCTHTCIYRPPLSDKISHHFQCVRLAARHLVNPPPTQVSMLAQICLPFFASIFFSKVRTTQSIKLPTLICGGAGEQRELLFVFANMRHWRLNVWLVRWCELLSDICLKNHVEWSFKVIFRCSHVRIWDSVSWTRGAPEAQTKPRRGTPHFRSLDARCPLWFASFPHKSSAICMCSRACVCVCGEHLGVLWSSGAVWERQTAPRKCPGPPRSSYERLRSVWNPLGATGSREEDNARDVPVYISVHPVYIQCTFQCTLALCLCFLDIFAREPNFDKNMIKYFFF